MGGDAAAGGGARSRNDCQSLVIDWSDEEVDAAAPGPVGAPRNLPRPPFLSQALLSYVHGFGKTKRNVQPNPALSCYAQPCLSYQRRTVRFGWHSANTT